MNYPILLHTSIDDFENVNRQLIEEIENYKQLLGKRRKGHFTVTSMDWGTNLPRTYMPIVNKHICPILDQFTKKFYYTSYNISYSWFHQYEESSAYPWHHHSTDPLVALYFVELPDPQLSTRFLNADFVEFKAGDLVIFPGWWPHYSPRNETGMRKTVIALNISLDKDSFAQKKISEDHPIVTVSR